MALRFFVGLYQPSDAQHFTRACIHVQRLATRRKPLGCTELLLDSRAFNELRHYGHYRATPQQFADHVHRIADVALVDRLVPATQTTCVRPRSCEKQV